MADNYIEKRMEELRNGRATKRPTATPSLRPLNLRRKLILDFPPQRVLLLAGTDTTLSHPIAKAFRTTDSKTALYDQSSTDSPNLAQQIGLRHGLLTIPQSHIDPTHSGIATNQTSPQSDSTSNPSASHPQTPSISSDLTPKLQVLLKSWRDLDIVILLPEALHLLPELQQIWSDHKSHYPIPTDYQPRLLLITHTSTAQALPNGTRLQPSPVTDIPQIHTVELQLPINPTPSQIKTLTTTLLYLSLPESIHLSTPTLRIQ